MPVSLRRSPRHTISELFDLTHARADLIVRGVGIGLSVFALDVAAIAICDRTATIKRDAALISAVDIAWVVATAETDPARRRELLSAAWATDGSLIDPPLQGSGIDAIIACGDAVVTHYPGHRFVRTTGIDVHNGVAPYGWELHDSSGDAVLDGTDIAETNDAGQLVRIVGFFGPIADHE